MGLDMYLYKKHYVWNEDRKSVKISIPKVKVNTKRVSEITELVGQWRKANAIHKWFVDNVQSGEDDCKQYAVSRKQLEELFALTSKVIKASKLVKGKVKNGKTMQNSKWVPIMEDGKYIKNPSTAEKLLPVQEGFFFGSKEYDQYYYQDLKSTHKILEDLLKEKDNADFYYQSSW